MKNCKKGDNSVDKNLNRLIGENENNDFKYEENFNNIIQELFNSCHGFKLDGCSTKKTTQNKFKTNRFFKDGEELGFYIDAVLDKYDDYLNVYYTGSIYEHNQNCRRVDRFD